MRKEFNIMDNINLCNQAIDFTGFLSKGQKEILKYILVFDDKGGVTAETIKNSSNISRQAANIHLKHLMDRGFVNREKNRIYVYYAKKRKLQELIETYETGKSLNKK
jgi:predicted transcriptional regulator